MLSVRADETRAVSLRECVLAAMEKNFGVAIARHDFAEARYELRAAYGSQYDPTFTAGVGRTYLDAPADLDPKKAGIDNNYQQQLDSVSMGLSGRLTPGLSVDVGVQSAFDSAITPAIFPFPRETNNYASAATINMRQSLLKNFWIDQGRTEIAVSRKNLKISELGLKSQMMSTAAAVGSAYYDLIFAEENLKVQRKALAFAEEILRAEKRRVAAGSIPELEVALSESHLASAKAGVAGAEEILYSARNSLRSLISNDLVSGREESLQPSDPLLVAVQSPDRAAVFQRALSQRPDVLEARENVEKRGLIVRLNNNQRFPRLDIVGSFGGLAVNPTWGDSVDSVGNLEHTRYGAGLVFSIPLGNVAARNRYKASVEEKEKSVLSLKQTEQKAWVDVDTVLKALPAIAQRLESTHQAETFAEQAVATERSKLNSGATTVFLVLQEEKNLIAAQIGSILAKIDYQKALIRLTLNEGSILDQYQVVAAVK
ncbi:MAG TPA: TolC family protein [Candidatus Limnocylindria bacterium]|nr:TolC family protein [Candidatus Limnocylindria bacterium]